MYPLPPDIESHYLDINTGLRVHYLTSGHPKNPVLLLLHGFPELAFSWRKVMPLLADMGYRVLAPDLRGYGHTTGWPRGYIVDLEPYRFPSLVLDQLAFLDALQIDQLHAVIGHDFGAPVAAWCALLRPDRCKKLCVMSAPFAGPPKLRSSAQPALDSALASNNPPLKHYQHYFSSAQANADMLSAPQGLSLFLKQYYFTKSATWPDNSPYELDGWQASSLAKMPGYYIMPRSQTMPSVCAELCNGILLEMPWLSPDEHEVYVETYARTGFQGGLNWYRATHDPASLRYQSTFHGLQIEVPTLFIAGNKDWGTYQTPGALNAMETRACKAYAGTQLIAGAGHWVQQEQPEALASSLEAFL